MLVLLTNLALAEQELADVVRLFYGMEPITYTLQPGACARLVITHKHQQESDHWVEEFRITSKNDTVHHTIYPYDAGMIKDEIEEKRKLRRASKLGLYHALEELTEKHLPWGALTGIRPTRLYRQLVRELGDADAKDMLVNQFQVSKGKYKLIEDVIAAQKRIYTEKDDRHVDVYIGIPFCPTRCLYCSFISFDLSKKKAPLIEYTNALYMELAWLSVYLKETGKKLRSVYIGGGTPTAIPLPLLLGIIERINQLRKPHVELTVEAGRADTLNDDVFKRFHDLQVNRISINAQTMNDTTLVDMNRPHTADDVVRCIDEASHYKFCINMDLIMGLPGEGIADAERTLALTKNLPIDNLTIHTLAIKRSSKLKEAMEQYDLSNEQMVEHMIELAQQTAYGMGMEPYYMYRQKFMSGNLENVGFSTPGKESIYNIDIMEETHNVIALGASGVSKRMYYDENRHVRLANPKSIDHYIKNIDALIAKKRDFFS